MPHGGPDWGTPGPLATVYTLEDMAELAARLGSIDTFDRRGNIVWLDDFEGTIKKWNETTDGTGGSIAISSEAARNGGFSAKFISPDEWNAKIGLEKYLPPPVESNIGFEYSWAHAHDLKYIYQHAHFVEMGKSYYFRLRYELDQDRLAYWSDEPDWVDLKPRVYTAHAYHVWNTVKLVVDYLKKEYLRVIFNGTPFDLKGIVPQIGPGGTPPSLRIYIYAVNGTKVNKVMYTDDVIITQNEP